ncbi:MAG: CDP-diacylglycerol--glycerol-3-phosphate 3-phosphatidyltransferase [Clostridia bacterium]|nr:CDP-diacylglycerol--glycerol-3-phosphate 3-phosphatidyltransferase [Clostridia bacterium]
MKKVLDSILSLNLPNKLTLLRIALVPVYLLLLAGGLDWLALVVFVVASLTDMADGKIARKYNLITNFGKFMDPIADKMLTHTAFIMLCAMGRLNAWACIIFIGREFVVSGLRLCAVEQGHVIAAGMSGKIKTVLQMALAIWLTVLPGVPVITNLLVLAAAALTLYSMVEYVWQNRAVLGGAK